jgi:hypothetical protein
VTIKNEKMLLQEMLIRDGMRSSSAAIKLIVAVIAIVPSECEGTLFPKEASECFAESGPRQKTWNDAFGRHR